MDGGIGAATAAIGEAVSQIATTGVETIGTTAIESVSSTIETVGPLESVTGPKIAKPILDDALANGTDDAFKHLAEMDLSELPESESLSQAEAQESKILPLTEQHYEVPVSEVTAEEEDGEETDSEEIPMEPNEPVDLTKYRQQKEKIKAQEKDEEKLGEEEQKRLDTLTFLQDNPELLDALGDVSSLSEETIKNIMEKIEKIKAQEKDEKKLTLLDLLLSILLGSLVTVQEETQTAAMATTAA